MINDTFLDNATTITGVARGVNDAGNGWIFPLVLFFTFIIVFMIGIKYEEYPNVLLADAYLCALLAGALYALKLMPSTGLILPTIILIAAIILKKWGG